MFKQTKLGVTYSLFSGEELLEPSIMQIREHVDYINVVYQKKSWFGDDASPGLLDLLSRLLREKIIDSIIEFPFSGWGVSAANRFHQRLLINQVIKKKMIGVHDLRAAECTHCMIMDVDEFYIPEEFAKAKEFIVKNDITHSCCGLYDYKLSPIYRSRDIANYAVPFIFKLKFYSQIKRHHCMPCYIDPLRSFQFNPFPYRLFSPDKFFYLNSICMHHMTGIRRDFNKKLNASITNVSPNGAKFVEDFRKKHNSIANLNEEKLLETGGGYIKVNDIFSLKQIFGFE